MRIILNITGTPEAIAEAKRRVFEFVNDYLLTDCRGSEYKVEGIEGVEIIEEVVLNEKPVVEQIGRYAGYTKDFELKKGEACTLYHDGEKIHALVVSANWFDEYGWYVEFTRRHGGKYGYFKQGMDGGAVRRGWV